MLPAKLNRKATAETREAKLPKPNGLYGPGGDLDSRTRKPHLSLDGTLEKMFCISCGAPSGWVTAEVVAVATYVCPDCTAKAGGPLPLPRLNIPE